MLKVNVDVNVGDCYAQLITDSSKQTCKVESNNERIARATCTKVFGVDNLIMF